ncbi:MAG: MerR family DNA-binding transcriptional regulator [Acutalibacteraceae bacterium]
METLSGLPRANIRYYESEGLITPKRAESGYQGNIRRPMQRCCCA